MKPLKWLDLPPVYLVLMMLAAKLWADLMPFAQADTATLDVAGGALIALGVGLAISAAVTMMAAKTPVEPRKTPKSLVTTGPFGFSRNPIYLAMAVVLTGWIAILGAATSIAALILFIAIINARFIGPEEAALAEVFPEAFTAWSAKVRRWI